MGQFWDQKSCSKIFFVKFNLSLQKYFASNAVTYFQNEFIPTKMTTTKTMTTTTTAFSLESNNLDVVFVAFHAESIHFTCNIKWQNYLIKGIYFTVKLSIGFSFIISTYSNRNFQSQMVINNRNMVFILDYYYTFSANNQKMMTIYL